MSEPYKGAKKKGAKGAAMGIGKGLVGLVAKPIGGAVGLVGCSVQGAVSTPGTIKRAVTGKPNAASASQVSMAAAAAADAIPEESKSDGGMEFDADADNQDNFNTAIGPEGNPVDDRETIGDAMSMRTDSVSVQDVEAYNQEKADIHAEL